MVAVEACFPIFPGIRLSPRIIGMQNLGPWMRTDYLTAQFVLQCFRLFQVGGIESFGEPVVNLTHQRTRGRDGRVLRVAAQGSSLYAFKYFCAHLLSESDRIAEIRIGQF